MTPVEHRFSFILGTYSQVFNINCVFYETVISEVVSTMLIVYVAGHKAICDFMS